MGAKNDQKVKIPLIGLLAVKNLLITKEDLQKGLLKCAKEPDFNLALKDYFLSQELISPLNVERLMRAAKALDIRQKEFKFGAIAIRKGFISQSVLKLALDEQKNDIKNKKKVRRVGDLLVDAGMLSTQQRDDILLLQKRIKQEIQQFADVPEQGFAADQGKAVSKRAGGEEAPENIDSTEKEASQLLEPEPLEGGVNLTISKDLITAFFLKTDHFDKNLTLQQVKKALHDKGIVLGVVVDEMIEVFLNSSGFRTKPFRVAKGTHSVNGKDARVEFFFNTDHLRVGGLAHDGAIDFKDRGEIPFVEEDTVLAEKIPMVESWCGRTIYGDEVETVPAKDIALKCGKGAKLSGDGFKVLAAVSGFPKYALSGHICVHQEYRTEGDVDYNTGHIEYSGNVTIKGRIKSGFRVKGNAVQTVEIDGGTVEADGDVTVSGGINEGKIYSRGNVYAKFVHNSEIVCMGNVIVQKEIVDTKVESSGSCVVENGKIIASGITAKMGVKSQHIGTQMSAPSIIKVGHDVFTKKELEKNQTRLDNLKKQVEQHRENKAELKNKRLALQKQITESAHLQDQAQLEEKEMNATLAAMKNKTVSTDTVHEFEKKIVQLRTTAEKAEANLDACFDQTEVIENLIKEEEREIELLDKECEDFQEERANLIQWSNDNPGKSIVIVQGTIMPETLIRGEHCEKRVNETIQRSKIVEVPCTSEGRQDLETYEMQVTPI